MKALLWLALLALAGPVAAGDFSVELGTDVVHARGLRVVSVAYENANSRFRVGEFGQDGIEVRFYGAEYVWHPWERCSLSFGLVHLERLTPLSGTHWNFQSGARCALSEKVFAGFMHFSHGRGLGIEPNKTNNGFNFLTVGTTF